MKFPESIEGITGIDAQCDEQITEVKATFESQVQYLEQLRQEHLAFVNNYRQDKLEQANKTYSQDIKDELLLKLTRFQEMRQTWLENVEKEDWCLNDKEFDSALKEIDQCYQRVNDIKSNTIGVMQFENRVLDFEKNSDFFSFQFCLGQIDFFYESSEKQLIKGPLQTLVGHSNQVNAIVFLPDDQLASGSDDNSIKVWNHETGEQLYELNDHCGQVLCLLLLENGLLASGTLDAVINIWDLKERKLVKTLIGHEEGIVSLLELPNGNLVSSSRDYTIKLWNPDKDGSDALIRSMGDESELKGWCRLTLLPNGNLIAYTVPFKTFTEDPCYFSIWDLENGQLVKLIDTGNFQTCLLTVLDNHQIAIVDGSGLTDSWCLNTKKITSSKRFNSRFNTAVTQLPNGYFIICLSNYGGDHFSLAIWDLNIHNDIQNGQLIKSISTDHYGLVQCIAVSNDGKKIATGSTDKNIKIWKLEWNII